MRTTNHRKLLHQLDNCTPAAGQVSIQSTRSEVRMACKSQYLHFSDYRYAAPVIAICPVRLKLLGEMPYNHKRFFSKSTKKSLLCAHLQKHGPCSRLETTHSHSCLELIKRSLHDYTITHLQCAVHYRIKYSRIKIHAAVNRTVEGIL